MFVYLAVVTEVSQNDEKSKSMFISIQSFLYFTLFYSINVTIFREKNEALLIE
jgi:hypothetical protein